MSDFHQHGPITTIHRLGNPDPRLLERELAALPAKSRPVLILPCHARELGSPALRRIASELQKTRFLKRIIVGLDGADAPTAQKAVRFFKGIGKNTTVLWNDGPAVGALLGEMERLGLEPGPAGKGRNLRICLGWFLACTEAPCAAIHDCDIANYDQGMLVRLAYPVAAAGMGFEVSKAFSARFSTRLDGRAMRLLAAPLIRAMSGMDGLAENIAPLGFLRYPLSGEICLSRRVAGLLALPSDWGVETAMMGGAFRVCDPQRICQVDIAESHDHRHQALSEKDPSSGLNKMGFDIALCLLRLASAGNSGAGARDFSRLVSEYRRAAKPLLDSYAADARMNLLEYDRELEKRTVDLFADCIRRAVREHRTNHLAPVGAPPWEKVLKSHPQLGDLLRKAAAL
jgi:glucosyl-3-phosphoglycerate synthase